jgi:hypothetical protein
MVTDCGGASAAADVSAARCCRGGAHLLGAAAVRALRLDGADNLHARHNLAEDDVLAVQPARVGCVCGRAGGARTS